MTLCDRNNTSLPGDWEHAAIMRSRRKYLCRRGSFALFHAVRDLDAAQRNETAWIGFDMGKCVVLSRAGSLMQVCTPIYC